MVEALDSNGARFSGNQERERQPLSFCLEVCARIKDSRDLRRLRTKGVANAPVFLADAKNRLPWLKEFLKQADPRKICIRTAEQSSFGDATGIMSKFCVEARMESMAPVGKVGMVVVWTDGKRVIPFTDTGDKLVGKNGFRGYKLDEDGVIFVRKDEGFQPIVSQKGGVVAANFYMVKKELLQSPNLDLARMTPEKTIVLVHEAMGDK